MAQPKLTEASRTSRNVGGHGVDKEESVPTLEIFHKVTMTPEQLRKFSRPLDFGTVDIQNSTDFVCDLSKINGQEAEDPGCTASQGKRMSTRSVELETKHSQGQDLIREATKTATEKIHGTSENYSQLVLGLCQQLLDAAVRRLEDEWPELVRAATVVNQWQRRVAFRQSFMDSKREYAVPETVEQICFRRVRTVIESEMHGLLVGLKHVVHGVVSQVESMGESLRTQQAYLRQAQSQELKTRASSARASARTWAHDMRAVDQHHHMLRETQLRREKVQVQLQGEEALRISTEEARNQRVYREAIEREFDNRAGLLARKQEQAYQQMERHVSTIHAARQIEAFASWRRVVQESIRQKSADDRTELENVILDLHTQVTVVRREEKKRMQRRMDAVLHLLGAVTSGHIMELFERIFWVWHERARHKRGRVMPPCIAEFRATTKAKAQLSALTASVHAELAALRKEQVAAAMQFLIYRRPEVTATEKQLMLGVLVLERPRHLDVQRRVVHNANKARRLLCFGRWQRFHFNRRVRHMLSALSHRRRWLVLHTVRHWRGEVEMRHSKDTLATQKQTRSYLWSSLGLSVRVLWRAWRGLLSSHRNERLGRMRRVANVIRNNRTHAVIRVWRMHIRERKALVALVTARVLHLRVKSVLLAWRDAVLGVREFIEYPVRKFWEGALRTLLGDPRSAPLLAQHLGVEAWMTLRVASRCTGGRVFDNNDTWRTLLPGLAPHEVSECVHRVKVMCSITPHPPQVLLREWFQFARREGADRAGRVARMLQLNTELRPTRRLFTAWQILLTQSYIGAQEAMAQRFRVLLRGSLRTWWAALVAARAYQRPPPLHVALQHVLKHVPTSQDRLHQAAQLHVYNLSKSEKERQESVDSYLDQEGAMHPDCELALRPRVYPKLTQTQTEQVLLCCQAMDAVSGTLKRTQQAVVATAQQKQREIDALHHQIRSRTSTTLQWYAHAQQQPVLPSHGSRPASSSSIDRVRSAHATMVNNSDSNLIGRAESNDARGVPAGPGRSAPLVDLRLSADGKNEVAAVARAPKLLVPHPPSSNKSAAHEYKSAETTKPTMKPELADRLKLDLSAVLARNALGGTEDRSQPAGMPTERAHTPATRRISMHGVTETTGSKFPSTARVGADGDGATANPPRPPPLVTGVRPSTTRTACAHASVSRTEQVKKANSNSNSDAISKPTANAHVHVHAHTHRATSSPCVSYDGPESGSWIDVGLSSMPDFTNILEPVGYGFHYLDAEAHADQDAAETSHVEMINNPICNRKTSVVSSSGDVVPVGVDKYRLDLHTDCIEPIRISPHGEDSLQSSVLMMHPAPDTGFDRGWQVDTVHNPGSQSARSRVAATGRSYMQTSEYGEPARPKTARYSGPRSSLVMRARSSDVNRARLTIDSDSHGRGGYSSIHRVTRNPKAHDSAQGMSLMSGVGVQATNQVHENQKMLNEAKRDLQQMRIALDAAVFESSRQD